jgi:nucleotide-binding universal stress UspA family protein
MFSTMVVATDGSEHGDRAVTTAHRLAVESRARVVVVHVKELLLGKSAGYPVAADERDLEAKIEQQISNMKAAGVDAELREHAIVLGGPAPLIAGDAEQVGADLIVAGTHGHNPVVGLLLGSVTQRLLSIAPCPVLVVPPDGNERNIRAPVAELR